MIGRFSEEHDAIVNALGDLRRTAGDGADPSARVAALRGLLDPHTEAEERSLFAPLRRDPEFADVVDALCAEHTAINAALDAVEQDQPEAVAALEHLLMRHIDKEENGLFPAAIMAGIDWDAVTAS